MNQKNIYKNIEKGKKAGTNWSEHNYKFYTFKQKKSLRMLIEKMFQNATV